MSSKVHLWAAGGLPAAVFAIRHPGIHSSFGRLVAGRPARNTPIVGVGSGGAISTLEGRPEEAMGALARTEVIITGSGTPIHLPHIAGPGVLITHDDIALQFDAGRATTMRLAAAGLPLPQLTAVFITHHHSDHVVGLTDLLLTRWLDDLERTGQKPLPVFVPAGPAEELVSRLLDPWEGEIAMRAEHQDRPDSPHPDVRAFEPNDWARRVFRQDDVKVDAFRVRHEPVSPAVGYRVTVPEGVIVISGDTVVCSELERAAEDADVLIHEAFCLRAVPEGLLSDLDRLAAYHADAYQVGKMAARLDVDTLILTHLIPPITRENVRDAFIDEVRNAGFDGRLIVADDLTRIGLD